MADNGPEKKKDPFEEKEDLFMPTGELKGGYDMGMARAYALDHAKKTHGEYVGRGKDRRLLVWEMESARFDEDAECWEIVLSCQPEKAQVEQKGVWVYHVRAMGGLMPGTPIQKQSLAYTLPTATTGRSRRWTYAASLLGIAVIGGIIFYVAALGMPPPAPPATGTRGSVPTPTAQGAGAITLAETPTLRPAPPSLPTPTARPPVAMPKSPTPQAAPIATAATFKASTLTPVLESGADVTELAYDSGIMEAGWATGGWQGGAAVRFTPPRAPWVLTGVKVGAWYSKPEDATREFYIEVWDENREELFRGAWTYQDFFKLGSGSWATIDIPDVTLFGDFYVGVFPNDGEGGHVLWIGFEKAEPIAERSYDVRYDTNVIETGPHRSDRDPLDWSIRALGRPRTDTLLPTPTLTPTSIPKPTATAALPPLTGHIAFASNRGRDWQIYVTNADGTGLRRLTVTTGGNWDPTWNSDGKYIAFTSKRDGNREIYVMNADGTNQRRLTFNPADDWSPAWGP